MGNLVCGIVVIIICSIAYWYAWRLFAKKRHTNALVLLILCGLILRLFISADFFLHSWDERYHAMVAKNLIEHPLEPTLYDDPALDYDYRDWSANHIWLHKQPLPLWSMAISMYFFGVNEIALRLPSILLSTIGILLTFLIGRRLFNRKVGFIAAFLYSINGLVLELTGGRVATDHIDLFMLFFVELAVFLAILYSERKKTLYNILCGICIGAAILSKWLPALIVLPVWFLFVINAKRFSTKEILSHFTVLCLTIIIVVLPWQLFIYYKYPAESSWESYSNFMHFTKVLNDRGGAFYYHFDQMRMLYGELVYIPIVWFIYKAIKRRSNLIRWSLIVWIIVPYLFFSVAQTKMQAYTAFTAPAIFIVIAVFWQYLYSYRAIFSYKWLNYALLFLLLAMPIRYSIERMKPFERRDRNPQWTKDLRLLNEASVGGKKIIFNIDYPIEAMFYTDFVAYGSMPDTIQIQDLMKNGYRIYINDNAKLDNQIRRLEGIEIVKLASK